MSNSLFKFSWAFEQISERRSLREKHKSQFCKIHYKDKERNCKYYTESMDANESGYVCICKEAR